MEILVGNISKSDLEKIPEKERIFFLLIGHLANELNILYKFLIMCFNRHESDIEAINRAQLYQALTINTILIGKIYEAWRMLEKLIKSNIIKDYEPLLSQNVKNIMAELIVYFGNKNLIKSVRDKFAFHYDFKKLKQGFENIPADTDFEIYLSESYANSFYYPSAAATHYAILHMIDQDEKVAVGKLFDEVQKISGKMIDFIGHLMSVIVKKYLLEDGKRQMALKPLDIGEQPDLGKTTIPFFVKAPKPNPPDI
jgi:hypothetical protein